jgi:hypothetical protein
VKARTFARVLGLVVVLMATLGVTSASAASPVLQFETSGSVLPVPFTAEGGPVTAVMSNFEPVVHCSGSSGEGAITGARTTLSTYVFTGCETEGGVRCESAGANEKEIRTPLIQADLVYLHESVKEVAMLLAPDRGVYMEFACGGKHVTARGPFLSPVGPINQETTSFTAELRCSGTTQVPAEFGEGDARQPAIPTAEVEGGPFGTTGVELSFAIHTSLPVTVRAISAAEVEAEAKRRDDEAAARKRHDDAEAAKAAAAKKRGEEEAAKKRGEEEAEQRSAEKRAKEKARVRHRAKALKQCRKANTKRARVRCERRAKKRFAVPHPNRRY